VTGKIVCSNCHLGTDELILALPQGVLAGDTLEVGFQIPVKKTNAQVQSDGSVGPIQVGGVLVLPDNMNIESKSASNWSYWSSDEKESIRFGPLSAEYGVQVLTVLVSRESFPSSVTVYGGGNRGRGQIYPDGTASNINNQRVEIGGLLTLLSSKIKRYGNVYGMITLDGSRDI
jgi:apocytochrome f